VPAQPSASSNLVSSAQMSADLFLCPRVTQRNSNNAHVIGLSARWPSPLKAFVRRAPSRIRTRRFQGQPTADLVILYLIVAFRCVACGRYAVRTEKLRLLHEKYASLNASGASFALPLVPTPLTCRRSGRASSRCASQARPLRQDNFLKLTTPFPGGAIHSPVPSWSARRMTRVTESSWKR
jgi:hypothetical protein